MKTSLRGVLQVVAAVGAMIALCGGMVVWNRTLVDWWVPALVALAGASVLLRPLSSTWRKFTGSESTAINMMSHIAFFGCLIYFGVLEANYLYPGRGDKMQHVAVTVEKKYTKEHTKVRRLTNGVTVPAGKYKTYHAKFVFADGRSKDIQMPLNDYNHLRQGSETEINLCTGILGWPVMKD